LSFRRGGGGKVVSWPGRKKEKKNPPMGGGLGEKGCVEKGAHIRRVDKRRETNV